MSFSFYDIYYFHDIMRFMAEKKNDNSQTTLVTLSEFVCKSGKIEFKED